MRLFLFLGGHKKSEYKENPLSLRLQIMKVRRFLIYTCYYFNGRLHRGMSHRESGVQGVGLPEFCLKPPSQQKNTPKGRRFSKFPRQEVASAYHPGYFLINIALFTAKFLLTCILPLLYASAVEKQCLINYISRRRRVGCVYSSQWESRASARHHRTEQRFVEAEILEGLVETDRVILHPSDKISDGVSVVEQQ